MKFLYPIIFSLSLLLQSFAFAQTTNIATPNQTNNFSSVKATDFIGKTVKNRRGEKLGKIEEIVFTPQGSLEYAVIATGGFLGMGESHVPVPFSRLQIKPNDAIAYLDATKENLQNAPAIAKDNWAINDRHWRQAADVYFALDIPEVKPKPGASTAAGVQPPLLEFSKLDVNKDGFIDEQEVAAAPQLNLQFLSLDVDTDRRLNQTEFSAFEARELPPSAPPKQ